LTSGLFFLSPATGFLLGTLIGGRFSDRVRELKIEYKLMIIDVKQTVRKWIVRRDGLRLPQDRLRSGFACWFILIPASTLIFGWGTEKHIGGLALPIATAFFASMGILAAFAGLNTYCAGKSPVGANVGGMLTR
jgi:MFS family permease